MKQKYSALEASLLSFVNVSGKTLDERSQTFNDWINARGALYVRPYSQVLLEPALHKTKISDEFGADVVIVINFSYQDYLGLANIIKLMLGQPEVPQLVGVVTAAISRRTAMSKKYFQFLAALSIALAAFPCTTLANDQVREFAATIACSQMPLDACTWLDSENYANLQASYKAQLRQKFCGTTNVNVARQMATSAEPSEYPNPNCTRTLQRLGEL